MKNFTKISNGVNKKISPKVISLIFGILVICFVVGFYVFAWAEPQQVPPGCTSGKPGCDAPINVGSTGQYKSGSLRVAGLTVDSSTYLATTSGNVGIGTRNPGAKLDVAGMIGTQGGDGVGLRMLNTNTNTFYGVGAWGNRLEWYRNQGENYYWAMLTSEGGKWRFGGYADSVGPLLQVMGDTYISGNVGIGTTTPAGLLDVKNFLTVFDETGAPIKDVVVLGRGGGPGSDIEIYGAQGRDGNGNDQVDKIFYDSNRHIFRAKDVTPSVAGPILMIIEPTGSLQFKDVVAGSNIQINRKAVTAHAAGNVPSSLGLSISDGAESGIFIINERNDDKTFNNQYIRFNTHEGNVSVGERMRIAPNGNVGIGTVSPGYKLDVNGDINLPAAGFLRIAGSAGSSGQVLTRTATGMTWQAAAGGIGGIGGSGTTNYVSKFTADTTIGNSQIYDNGTNVGIGTVNPNDILTINGPIRIMPRSSATCDGNHNGAMYYDSDDHNIYFCKNGSWRNLMTPGNTSAICGKGLFQDPCNCEGGSTTISKVYEGGRGSCTVTADTGSCSVTCTGSLCAYTCCVCRP